MSDVHEIRMRHPGRNALGRELMDWLQAELDTAGARPVLLTGSDGAFSAGLDLKQVAALTPADVEPFLRQIDAVAERLLLHPAPTVAWINGHAIAGGCVLALCCDQRFAADEPGCKIGLNEVALGVPFPPRILRICRHRVPRRHHARVLLGAELFAPRQALAVGLVDEVAADTGAAARARLAALAALPRAAYAHEKRLLCRELVAVGPEDERRFREEELPLWLAPEVKERVRAVLRR